MIVYHGNDHKLPNPIFGFGRSDNDYGQGFYTTLHYSKAAEWAIANGADSSYVNKYEINTDNLNVIHLNEYGTLTWIAEIICNRGARGESSMILGNKIVEKYKIDLSDADIIIGYRADDSYSDIVDSFLKNEINIDEVEKLFKKGELGDQIFIKSQKAFDALKFKGVDEIKESDFTNQNEIQARIEVSKFLKNRTNQIYVNGYSPIGITARDAANNFYKYDSQYNYYTSTEDVNLSSNLDKQLGETS